MSTLTQDQIRQTVRERYGDVAAGEGAGCGCSPGCCSPPSSARPNDLSLNLGYSPEETGSLPDGANMGLGCGNPQAIAALQPGEVVLDLGSGGGFDCFLAARQVGPQGQVIGVDMTDKMIMKARSNSEKGDYVNVDFRLGEIENLPVGDASIDVIMSNCVINLSPNKARVFAEAFRVLRPGGRLAVSDIVAATPLPEDVQRDMDLYAGCVAGAATIDEVVAILQLAGFERIRVTPKRGSDPLLGAMIPGSDVADYVLSAHIEAVKPEA